MASQSRRSARAASPELQPAELDDHVVQGAQALQRGLALLDLIAEAPSPMRFGEVVARAGLSKGTVHRMLAALVEARLVAYDAAEQTYRLGVRLFEMAHRVWDSFDLRAAAEPELRRLVEATGETVRLGVLDNDEVLWIDQREAARPIRLGNGVGSRVTLHGSSAGKAILAHLPPAARHRLLAGLSLTQVTASTITDRGALQSELDLVKARGYAVGIEEQTEGASSVAVPVLDARSEPLGAIAVIGPSYRLPPERLHGLGHDLIAAARRVSLNGGQVAMSLGATKPFAPPSPQVRCVVPATAFLGKAPVWLAKAEELLWVDILAPAIHLSDPESGESRTIPLGEIAGAVLPRRQGGFVAATQHGFRAFDLDSGKLTPLGPTGLDQFGMRLNDGCCDSTGRLWVGSLALDSSPGAGSLWRLDPDGVATRMDTGFHVSNGLALSPDERRLYFADSNARTVYAYDLDPATGTLSGRQPFVRIPEERGKPDGLAVDAEGCLWVALWDGWAVARYRPSGDLDRVVPLPIPRPTSCSFGGEGLKTLFISTARLRLSAEQLADAPLSGSVLAIEVAVPGLPVRPFGG